MKLFNTLSRQIEEFIPRDPNNKQVSLYSCGITAYDYAHLGNLRRYALDDLLTRVLARAGYQVTYIQNVTDVGHLVSDEDEGEDKVEKGAREAGRSPTEITKFFADYFYEKCAQLNYTHPTKITFASQHIPEQLALVKELEAKGFTYEIPGDGIYFDTSLDPNYGHLARLDLQNLKAGARVAQVEGKKNPTDFALWKFEKPGENRLQAWESPWAEKSFPGWHTECVAMSIKYLGPQYDLHTGGIDHIPVHHTNEIAQAESATEQSPYVKYWLHSNFLRINGEKMAKSKGNFYRLEDVTDKGFTPSALKYLFLTSHYRNELNFTWENMAGIQKYYDQLVAELLALKQYQGRNEFYDVVEDRMNALREKFYEPIFNDLNTPQALPVISQVIKSALPSTDKYDLVLEFDDVLGLGLRQAVAQLEQTEAQSSAPTTLAIEELEQELQELLSARALAKQNQDFAQSDKIRDQLAEQRIKVIDLPNGEQEISRF